MIDNSFKNHLKKINPNWKSKSRIFGQVIEDWFVDNITCECRGKFLLQKTNQKSYDCVCELCNKKIQIKSQKNIFKPNKDNTLRILGSEYKTTLKSINMSENWDLFLISYDKINFRVNQILKIDSDYINTKCVFPRKPLGPNARRAGWRGCYLDFNWNDVTEVFKDI